MRNLQMTERTMSNLNPSPAAPSSPEVTPKAKKAWSPPAMTVLKIRETAAAEGVGNDGLDVKGAS